MFVEIQQALVQRPPPADERRESAESAMGPEVVQPPMYSKFTDF